MRDAKILGKCKFKINHSSKIHKKTGNKKTKKWKEEIYAGLKFLEWPNLLALLHVEKGKEAAYRNNTNKD